MLEFLNLYNLEKFTYLKFTLPYFRLSEKDQIYFYKRYLIL